MESEQKIELFDVVELLIDRPGISVKAGTLGTVVDLLIKGAFLVEFEDPTGEDILLGAFTASEIRVSTAFADMKKPC